MPLPLGYYEMMGRVLAFIAESCLSFSKYFSRFAALLIFFLITSAVSAQDYSYYGSGGSNSGSGGITAAKGPPGHFAFVVDYSQYFVNYAANSAAAQQGTGSGYSLGLELDSPSTSLVGLWVLGVYYLSQSVQITPTSGTETDTFQAIEMPLLWGKSFGSHILVGLGAMFRYDLNNISRVTSSATTSINHQNFGLGTTQEFGVGFARFYLKGPGKTQGFADFKYCAGISNRSIGATDTWTENEMYFGLGVMF